MSWGAGRCGGPGGVAPWLARGPPKAGLAASALYYSKGGICPGVLLKYILSSNSSNIDSLLINSESIYFIIT